MCLISPEESRSYENKNMVSLIWEQRYIYVFRPVNIQYVLQESHDNLISLDISSQYIPIPIKQSEYSEFKDNVHWLNRLHIK